MHVAEDLVAQVMKRVVEGARVAVVAGEPEGPAQVVGLIELVENPEGAGGNAFGADSLRLLQYRISSLQGGDPGPEGPEGRVLGAAGERGVPLQDGLGIGGREDVEGHGGVGDAEIE